MTTRSITFAATRAHAAIARNSLARYLPTAAFPIAPLLPQHNVIALLPLTAFTSACVYHAADIVTT